MDNFPKFSNAHQSLMAKHLNETIFKQLKDKTTATGYTLAQAIQSGISNPDSGIGIYAGDNDSYQVFASLFNPIIEEYHGFDKTSSHHSDLLSELDNTANIDPNNEYILSTRIRVARNLQGFPLGTNISNSDRNKVEQLVRDTLLAFEGELAGNYYPLYQMDDSVKEQLIADHFLFKSGDRFLEAAGLNRNWPQGRGIFHNHDKTFLVWINEEDQLRIIAMQQGGDINEVFERLKKAIHAMEEKLVFLHDSRLGYIASCPTNLGTAMRASVHIKLPKLANNKVLFNEITEHYHLQIRGVHGEHSESESGIFDISNKRRLGISEKTCINDLYQGVKALIATEKSL